MTRLIDADALDMYERLRSYYGDAWRDAQKEIDNAPTVDAEPVKHGKWDYVTVVDEGFWRCSNCGTTSEALGAKVLYKYCPFCGAKMDAEQEARNGS